MDTCCSRLEAVAAADDDEDNRDEPSRDVHLESPDERYQKENHYECRRYWNTFWLMGVLSTVPSWLKSGPEMALAVIDTHVESAEKLPCFTFYLNFKMKKKRVRLRERDRVREREKERSAVGIHSSPFPAWEKQSSLFSFHFVVFLFIIRWHVGAIAE